MNDLPQNELLSAYLDGELTAAEQAEIEQLLADSPAARQLVEELRALRTMLQTLPREKLAEDLSRQVLRVAERRILTEEEPGAAEDGSMAPVPLGRSVLRRVLNRRTLTWLTLTAAIVLIIKISERWQGVPPLADAERKIALAKPLPPATGPVVPPSMRSADDADVKIAQTAAATPMLNYAPAGESVAVVRCTISPAAARKQAFERLLDANGVVWRQRPEPSGSAEGRKEKALRAGSQFSSRRSLSWQSIAPGEENLVEVEATPAQFDATLAGLKAQPALFHSFSVKRSAGAAYGGEPAASVAGQEKRPSSQLGGVDLSRPAAGAAPVAARAPSKAEPRVQQHVQMRRLAGPAAQQRVLFLLRVVGGDHPPVAAKPGDETKSDAAQPAEQATPPSNAPKPQK